MGCPKTTTQKETFLDLSLGVPSSPLDQQNPKARKSTRIQQPKAVTLQSCFELFASPERVNPEEQRSKIAHEQGKVPFCSECGIKEGITKTLKLSKCPEYLCVHLKRFQWDE